MEVALKKRGLRPNRMKITLIVLCVLCAATAAAQVGGAMSSQVIVYHIPDHPQHAEMHPMASEQSVLGGTAYRVEQGERPLWEFGPVSEQPSLGDVARAYRKEKLTAKKAQVVFEKQGS